MSRQIGDWIDERILKDTKKRRDKYNAYYCWQFLSFLFWVLFCFKVIKEGMKKDSGCNLCVLTVQLWFSPLPRSLTRASVFVLTMSHLEWTATLFVFNIFHPSPFCKIFFIIFSLSLLLYLSLIFRFFIVYLMMMTGDVKLVSLSSHTHMHAKHNHIRTWEGQKKQKTIFDWWPHCICTYAAWKTNTLTSTVCLHVWGFLFLDETVMK